MVFLLLLILCLDSHSITELLVFLILFFFICWILILCHVYSHKDFFPFLEIPLPLIGCFAYRSNFRFIRSSVEVNSCSNGVLFKMYFRGSVLSSNCFFMSSFTETVDPLGINFVQDCGRGSNLILYVNIQSS